MNLEKQKTAAEETQVKDKPLKVAIRVLLLGVVFVFLVVSYVFAFNSSFYPTFFNYKLDGTYTAENYYAASSLDLVVLEEYASVGEVREGDVAGYSVSGTKGSGLVTAVEDNVVVLERKSGELVRLSFSSITGKQVKTIPVLGLIFAAVFGYAGVVIFTILAIVLCAILTFSRINYENTPEGKALLARYRHDVAEKREKKRMLESIRKSGNINLDVFKILEGDFEQNKDKFYHFDYFIEGSLKEKYKYLLESVYNNYIYKEKLNKNETQILTNLFELMCEPMEFDIDMEYMLKDLILKAKIEDFDWQSFRDSAFKFIEKSTDSEELVRFMQVVYLMVLRNPKCQNSDFALILQESANKLPAADEENWSAGQVLAENGLKLIKT